MGSGLIYPISATGAQRREKSQAVRREKKLNLEDCMGLEKKSRGVRGNTMHLERADWCRNSDIS